MKFTFTKYKNKFISFFKENWILFAVIFVCLFNYLWQYGYFLSIDWIYGPQIKLVETQYYPNWTVWIYFQKIIAFIIPAWILQKMIIVSFFVLAYFGTKKLVRFFTEDKFVSNLAFLFYVFTPFFYSRFIQGQWSVIFAYSLAPFFLFYIFKYFNFTSAKNAISLGLILAVIISLNVHHLFLLGLILLVFSLFNLRKINLNFIYVVLLPILVNVYWIFSVGSSTNIENFGQNDLTAFRTINNSGVNIFLNILSLHGFWGEVFHRFTSLYQLNGNWLFIFGGIFLLVLWGALIQIKKKDKNALPIVLIAIFSVILSLSLGKGNIFYGLNKFLYENVPFYMGLRDAQKWTAILSLAYLYFIIHALIALFSSVKNKFAYKKYLCTLIAIFFVGYGFNMLFGFNGQLYAVDYPKDWYLLRGKFYKDNVALSGKYNILIFPWHQSMSYKFSNRIISNPAGLFFDGKTTKTLFGDNIEIGSIYSQSIRTESKIIEKYVGPNGIFRRVGVDKDTEEQFLESIKELGVNKILLFKEVDYLWYKKILDQMTFESFLSVYLESENLMVYEIKQ